MLIHFFPVIVEIFDLFADLVFGLNDIEVWDYEKAGLDRPVQEKMDRGVKLS